MSRLKIATTLKPVNWNCFWLGSLNVDLLKRLSTKLWKWMQPQPVAICKYQVLICCLAWDNFTAVWRFVVWIGYLNIYWAVNGAHLLISSHSLFFYSMHAAIVHSSYNDNIFFWICKRYFHYFTLKSRSLIWWYVHEITWTLVQFRSNKLHSRKTLYIQKQWKQHSLYYLFSCRRIFVQNKNSNKCKGHFGTLQSFLSAQSIKSIEIRDFSCLLHLTHF